ncbi:unnamed protein product [Albugo candida]|uniref:Uncharacterized protein n=1 Tax=Albugo candida TaxID=65357 RepID=A0A024FXR9_9STRA|nr:unnamed protein product [Albugo candida]|eukprot:CCI39354.1 unnamed protein product [Albugo candida]
MPITCIKVNIRALLIARYCSPISTCVQEAKQRLISRVYEQPNSHRIATRKVNISSYQSSDRVERTSIDIAAYLKHSAHHDLKCLMFSKCTAAAAPIIPASYPVDDLLILT